MQFQKGLEDSSFKRIRMAKPAEVPNLSFCHKMELTNWVPHGKIWFGHSISDENLPKKPPSNVNILMVLRVQWMHPNPNRIHCDRS